ncbi:dynamin family protein [Alkalinema pantanalense CENA528]|uniref:dynamin family protein n=1 Tax=Alkalinema pantanalense TaxID=1620705 RepID=UPI003D6FB146
MLSSTLPLQSLPQCQGLQDQVDRLFQLLGQEPTLQAQVETASIQASLKKAIAPTFEIVFAGAFSAGKSMLINALLERELLYSAEGHATGTECLIAYAEPNAERVVLTFLSEAEIREQVQILLQRLGIETVVNINNSSVIETLLGKMQDIIQTEGGESKSDRAKQASALKYLLKGFIENRNYIDTVANKTLSMEQFNFANLQEAASYARRGSNSAVLKRVEYYCNHPLLKDGNVLVDTPGIDAPVKKDAELTYSKIEHPDTSAVVCVLKAASAGDMTSEETAMLERIRSNPGIRDRVFYVFNRVDETWYNTQLRQRLEGLIQEQFKDSNRLYKTSGLLGFWGSQLRQTSGADRFGLDSLFGSPTETPQFVSEFNRYCSSSGKLPIERFRIDVRSYETPNENYVRILGEYGGALVEQLIKDSGIETFRSQITRYLTEEKRPMLLANLADDLQPLCIALRKTYLESWHGLKSQPQDISALKDQELQQLGRELKQVGDDFQAHIQDVINEIVGSNGNTAFETDFKKLKARMVSRLDELLNTFSVAAVHQRAQASHRRNSVVPLLGILAEAFYYLANGLEDVLVESSQEIVANFFQQLIHRVQKQDYYRRLYRMLGNDGGLEQNLRKLEEQAIAALMNEARTECDRYVRERPEFFAEGTASMFQLRQTLQQACRGYDFNNMVEAEAAIRQLLKLDFEQKVKDTVMRSFRQVINQTLNVCLLRNAADQMSLILQQYDHARGYLAKTLEKEAEDKIRQNQRLLSKVEQKMAVYNEAVNGVNACLEAMQLDRHRLPLVEDAEVDGSLPGDASEVLTVGTMDSIGS